MGLRLWKFGLMGLDVSLSFSSVFRDAPEKTMANALGTFAKLFSRVPHFSLLLSAHGTP